MLGQDLMVLVPLVGLLLWAAAEDVYRRRIPNWLTLALVRDGSAEQFYPVRSVEPLAGGGWPAGGVCLVFSAVCHRRPGGRAM